MESVENVSFYFHNFSNKFCHCSSRVRNFESYVRSEVAMPVMIVAFFDHLLFGGMQKLHHIRQAKTKPSYLSFGHT